MTSPTDVRGAVRQAGVWVAPVAVAGMWGWSRTHPEFVLGVRAGTNLRLFVTEMAGILPCMFVLIGLFELWVPREIVERHAGKGSGALAMLWMVLLATLQAGPLYAAFPVAVSLWRKGCAPRNVFVYLGAFAAMKVPMLTFEVACLGWQFSAARTLFTLPVFIFIAFLMERSLPVGYVPPGAAGEEVNPNVPSPSPQSRSPARDLSALRARSRDRVCDRQFLGLEAQSRAAQA